MGSFGTNNGASSSRRRHDIDHLKYPSHFARLVHVASLARSLASDWSTEVQEFSKELRAEHLAAFEDWLSLDMQQKQADIQQCAANHSRSAHSILLHWMKAENTEHLIPATAATHQRELFAMELEVLFLVV